MSRLVRRPKERGGKKKTNGACLNSAESKTKAVHAVPAAAKGGTSFEQELFLNWPVSRCAESKGKVHWQVRGVGGEAAGVCEVRGGVVQGGH